MNIETNRLNYLYQQYLLNALTLEERQEWIAHVENPKQEQQLKVLMDQDYDALKEQALLQVPELRNEEILAHIFEQPRTIRKKLWFGSYGKLAVAAAVATIIFGAGLFYYQTTIIRPAEVQAYTNDVAPGTQGATLTLANGKRIRLSDAGNGELARQAGVTITKSANGQLVYEVKATSQVDDHLGAINTLSTAKGETYQVRLPDGSMVWLNAASSLTYSAQLLEQGKRKVKLDGEGYFEIAKDATHPFVVATGKDEIEVLGTHFNVNAYTDEPVKKTTLLEGSVRISSGITKKLLKPGEQAVSRDGQLSVEPVDAELAVAWKNNKFIFEQQGIQEIMRIIARWYNVEVIYSGEPTKETFWGSVSRFDNVSSVLKRLEASGSVHFKIEGRRIYVLP